MPIDRFAIRDVIGGVLWNTPLSQAIFNIRLERAPTQVRFHFLTSWPCYARVEIFRMVHGELSLDMEQENLLRTGVELFGNPRQSHRILVTELEQERRYWYRISAPRKTPLLPAATGHVRSRGEFFTPRRNTWITINHIHVHDDSDDVGAGELSFSLGLYNAAEPRNRLVEPRFSAKTSVDSGSDFHRPFGPPSQQIGRSPDQIGIYVFGVDDDTTLWGAPWYGLGIVGMRPPDVMPTQIGARSTMSVDTAEALHILTTGSRMGRQEGRFAFDSAKGRLHYAVHGGFSSEVFDTLAERSTPPWKLVAKTNMELGDGGREAGLIGLEDGELGLALDQEGHLGRSEPGSRDRWETVEGPAFTSLVAKAMRSGSLVLAGLDRDEVLHVAQWREPRRGMPAWMAVGRAAPDLPAFIEDRDGSVHFVLRDSRLRPWYLRLERDGRPAHEPVRILAEPVVTPILDMAAEGHVELVTVLPDGSLAMLSLGEAGRPIDQERCEGRFAHALAVVEAEGTDRLVVAIDRDEQVLVRPLAERGGAFTALGTLEDLLEGLPEPDSRAQPSPGMGSNVTSS